MPIPTAVPAKPNPIPPTTEEIPIPETAPNPIAPQAILSP